MKTNTHFKDHYTSESFSPSLSLLTTQTPAMIPLLSDGELFGTHLSGSCLEPKAADGVQI